MQIGNLVLLLIIGGIMLEVTRMLIMHNDGQPTMELPDESCEIHRSTKDQQ